MPRVLVAEPHDATQAAIRAALAARGHEVLLAADAAAAGALQASHRPEAAVVAAGLAGVEALASRLRQADPLLLLVVTDEQHLGRARGVQAVLGLRANAYVADPTGPELGEKLALLLGQQSEARLRLRGVALLLSRPPLAEGEVRPGVVARLVHQAWRSLSDGALVLEGDGPGRRLFFERGVPVAVECEDPEEALEGWGRDGAPLPAGARRAAREALARGLPPGAALVAAGAVEPGEPLQAAMRAHLRRLLVRCVGARTGRWRFHAGDEFAAQLPLVELGPLPPILEGVRAHLPARHFADALKAVLEAYPSRTADFSLLLPALRLDAADERLARALDGRATTRAVLDAHRLELKELLSLLWVLSMTGAVVFHDAPEPPSGGAAPPAPRPRPPLPPDRAEALRLAALRILPASHFHALGVDIAAGAAEVELAWREITDRFDPAAFAGYQVGDLEDLLRAVQEKVAEARRVLGDDASRRDYLARLLAAAEAASPRRPGVVPEAEVALKRGERALRGRRGEEAVAALQEAAALNPAEPEYLAMLGFAELHRPGREGPARAAAARQRARAALALDPLHLRARVVLALAEALAGDEGAARAAADEALRAHPDAELARRVHLRLLRPARS